MAFAVPPHYRPALYLAAGAVSFGALSSLYSLLRRPAAHTFPSPLLTHRSGGSDLDRNLPYPPRDFIPGARDLETPYGLVRVYEWGPEDAERRVLLVHGISGSCVALLSLAEALVARGCRVMLPDLFGRGWSGGPTDLPYDNRLYASHILMCLASSPISWTGPRTFSIIGYSLGGAIVADFASYFPHLIEDVVLIAPGGLMEAEWRGRLLYSGLISESCMRGVVTRRLQSPAHSLKPPPAESLDPTWTAAEAAGQQGLERSLAEKIRGIDADAVVDWQLRHNAGFVPAFVSSIRYAPLRDRHDRWAILGERIKESKAAGSRDVMTFTSGSLLLILGRTDPIIRAKELVPKAMEVFGADHLDVQYYDCAHEVGTAKGPEIGELLARRWKLET